MRPCSHKFSTSVLTCTGGNSALRALPRQHIHSVDTKGEEAHLCSSTARGSFSHKPPLSPFCPTSFSASFTNFAADRVQSSPCIMQTDHAEAASAQVAGSSESSAMEAEMIQLDDPAFSLQAAVCSKPSRLSSETRLNHMTAGDTESGLGFRSHWLLPNPTEAHSEGTSKMQESQSQMTVQLSLHRGDREQSVSLAHVASMCTETASPDAMQIEEQVCISGTAQEAAAAAAGLPCLTATSSPCCTFLLPTALSQGIASSPAPGEISSGDSARRKSFSPLETGPVSILPMVENPETGLPSISCKALAQLLSGQHNSSLTALKIVDCRYTLFRIHCNKQNHDRHSCPYI